MGLYDLQPSTIDVLQPEEEKNSEDQVQPVVGLGQSGVILLQDQNQDCKTNADYAQH